jgi:hypothetical protein
LGQSAGACKKIRQLRVPVFGDQRVNAMAQSLCARKKLNCDLHHSV